MEAEVILIPKLTHIHLMISLLLYLKEAALKGLEQINVNPQFPSQKN